MSRVLRLSPEQAQILRTLQEGRNPVVFARDVLGVNLNPAQRRWFSLIRPGEDGWRWRYEAVLHVAANQIGKTLGLGVLILWAAWYKIGVDTTDQAKWLTSAYQWFHLAPSQPQAYLTLLDINKLLDGTHEAQVRPSILPRGLVSQVKIEQYYDGLSLWNGAIIQFRTTDERAKALNGRRAAGISYDEAAFEDHLKSVIHETLLMRLISTGGPLWLVSTPNGINDWYEIVTTVQEEALPRMAPEDDDPLLGGSALPGELLPMWENEDRWALLWSTVADNVGFGTTQAAVDRMERTIDQATKEQQLRGAFLEPADAYFVPSDLIDAAFKSKLPLEERPIPGHTYIASWDPSATTDPTVAVVLDVTKKPWRGVYFRRYEKPLGETKLLTEIFALHALYNGGATQAMRHIPKPRCLTTFDSTSMGGAMLAQSLAHLHPKKALNLAGPTAKSTGLKNTRTALNTGGLVLPIWPRMRREVLTYKLPDDKIVQDCVMCLMGAVDAATKGFSGDQTTNFQPHGRSTARRTR